jgi:protein-disulfide isomerase
MNQPNIRQSLAIPVTAGDHSSGPDHAPVTVVEYGDYECPICQANEPAFRQLRQLHGAAMRFVYRHFPMEDAHPHALMAAEAAEAAAAQGRFWEMHESLLAPGRQLGRASLSRYAEQLGLDMARFNAELNDEIYRQRIREHIAGGHSSHVRATPGVFVNGVVQDVSGGMNALFARVAAELGDRQRGR